MKTVSAHIPSFDNVREMNNHYVGNRGLLTIFSRTHILTSEWNSSLRRQAFSAAILARAVPHDPEPMTAILCLPLESGEGGSDGGEGEEGRVTANEGYGELLAWRGLNREPGH